MIFKTGNFFDNCYKEGQKDKKKNTTFFFKEGSQFTLPKNSAIWATINYPIDKLGVR